jgi:hypothetical protein
VRQRAAEREIFGTSKPIAFTYAKALHSLESGGGVDGATRAFYDEKLRINPNMKPQAAAREAADRVLRLLHYGGRNSRAMSYAEGGLFVAELDAADETVQMRVGVIASLDLVDQVKLHKYGLLPKIDKTDTDWEPHIQAVVEPYIREALEKHYS